MILGHHRIHEFYQIRRICTCHPRMEAADSGFVGSIPGPGTGDCQLDHLISFSLQFSTPIGGPTFTLSYASVKHPETHPLRSSSQTSTSLLLGQRGLGSSCKGTVESSCPFRRPDALAPATLPRPAARRRAPAASPPLRRGGGGVRGGRARSRGGPVVAASAPTQEGSDGG
jgi:hypothetical protein